jgi:hypothetical protein
MVDYRAVGFEYGGRTYRFDDAHCRWSPDELYVEAKGTRCGLSLVGVPFSGATELADLPGRVWEPDEEELSLYADTFAEGGLEVRGKDLWIMDGRIECRRYDAERRVLTVSFRLAVQDGECGDEGEADGVVYCRVNSSDGVEAWTARQRT